MNKMGKLMCRIERLCSEDFCVLKKMNAGTRCNFPLVNTAFAIYDTVQYRKQLNTHTEGHEFNRARSANCRGVNSDSEAISPCLLICCRC